jgi:hypothetical protein
MNQPILRTALRPPLGVQPDMPAHWHDVDLPFDVAAERLVKAHETDGLARDLPVMDLRTWAIREKGGQFALGPVSGRLEPLALRSTAFSHLAARVGAPAEFVRDKLPTELQLGLLNYLLASQDRPLATQLRLRGEEVTAVVSDRYAPLDPVLFVESLRLALREHGVLDDVRVRSLATGTTDALRLVLPAESHELKVGDVSHVGLDISTSSFGRSAVHVAGVLWRLVCLNGLRAPSKMGRFSFRHVGDTERLREGLRDAVPTALLHAQGFMHKWRESISRYIENVTEAIDTMRELMLSERQRVVGELEREHGGKLEADTWVSVYDATNALTAAAHDAEPARRLELETLAGEFLVRHVGRG